MIWKLRAVDPDLAQIFLNQIEVLQEIVDKSIQTAKEKEPKQAKEEEEAMRQAEEHMRFVVELERQKADEEKAKQEREEAAQREKEDIIAKAWKLATEDPEILDMFPRVRLSTPPSHQRQTDTGISRGPPMG